jgi:hypothetical protein
VLFRHGFTQRTPSHTVESIQHLEGVKAEFSQMFWNENRSFGLDQILNVDETGIFADTPPWRFYSQKGQSAKLKYSHKHSDRMTAVLTVRADGKKLPIFFIMKGTPGGSIEAQELLTYPAQHVYAVQEKAWMNARVWEMYVKNLLRYEIEEPTLLVLDNFDAHVSAASEELVGREAGCILVPLPPNATSVCQPLDVGGSEKKGPARPQPRRGWQ